MKYEATFESVHSHPLPKWYDDAKFGIFIHWGLYSVPAWAYAERGKSIVDLGEDPEPFHVQKYNPYSEWYLNTMRIPGTPGQRHHAQTYGDRDYYDFQRDFERESAKLDPAAWAELFEKAGAKYAVMVTKHHDGYCLWPCENRNPLRPELRSRRDLVGEVTEAVRARGLRMGLYYSSILDWTFKPQAMRDAESWLDHYLQSDEYAAYSLAQTRELIHRYHPSILWNDMGYPAQCDLNALFAEYYNAVEDGLINDRWLQRDARGMSLPEYVKYVEAHGGIMIQQEKYGDYTSPEYDTIFHLKARKWELTRGIGMSYGYNRNEDPANFMTGRDIICTLADVASKNGNMLLNVGPRADGSIEPAQAEALLEAGEWLRTNGEAIYATTYLPERQETVTDGGSRVSFTRRDDCVYAIVQDAAPGEEATIKGFALPESMRASVLGCAGEVAFECDGGDMKLRLPADAPKGSAYVLRFAAR